MLTPDRLLFVLSDLHIGGAYAAPGASPGDRGFRICTRVPELTAFVHAVAALDGPGRVELVINGDFVDFLSEDWPEEPRWRPFIDDGPAAAAVMRQLVDRDRPLFDALGAVLTAGHRLTILLGNHDVELSFPAVRAVLTEALGWRPTHDLVFLYDGEAYPVGKAIIEHGNRHDGFNIVDHDGLRRHRSAQSRGEALEERFHFRVPPGSNIVSHIMNPVKEDWPFIDLLKPEATGAVPLLVALAPERRSAMRAFLVEAEDAWHHSHGADAIPTWAGDISATQTPDDPLAEALREALGDDAAVAEALAAAQEAAPESDLDTSGDIGFLQTATGVLGLLTARSSRPLSSRLPALRRALTALQSDQSFDRTVETQTKYVEGAEHLIANGFDLVVFGHTHLAKDLVLPSGGRYLNTGTWADLMRFPTDRLTGPDTASVEAAIAAVCADLEARRFEPYLVFAPTFARLAIDANGEVLAADVRDWTGPESLR